MGEESAMHFLTVKFMLQTFLFSSCVTQNKVIHSYTHLTLKNLGVLIWIFNRFFFFPIVILDLANEKYLYEVRGKIIKREPSVFPVETVLYRQNRI